MSKWDAIVIGSGVGGSVTAALLDQAGRRVLVIEKNRALGGILASHRRDGFKLDTGSHLVSRGRHGPLGRVLAQLGRKGPRFLTHRIPVRSRGIFEITAPQTRAGLPRVALEAAHKLRLPARDVLALGRMIFQVLTLTGRELDAWDRKTLDAFVREHTEHPGAYFLFSFLASIFFVLPPWQVSAGEAIRCLRHTLLDYSLSYVEGGMDALIESLLGPVEVMAPARVVSILRKQDSFVVVTADGRELEAAQVACNLAPADLLSLIDLPDEWAARARAIKPSGNAHQLRIALGRPLVDEGCLIGGLTLDGLTLDDLSIDLMQRTVADIEQGRVTDPLAIYAPVPSNYDASLAPPGRQLIIASVYGPVLDHPIDPPERWRDRALAALARVIPHLEEELLFCELMPVPAVGRFMGKGGRGAISNGQFPGQVGADRLPVTTPIPGLFLCGDGAGGRGIGTELAASSGMEAAAAMLSAA